MRYVLGESALSILLSHLRLNIESVTIEELQRNLASVFGEGGALVLEKTVVKELFVQLNIPYKHEGGFDLKESVEQARKIFEAQRIMERVQRSELGERITR